MTSVFWRRPVSASDLTKTTALAGELALSFVGPIVLILTARDPSSGSEGGSLRSRAWAGTKATSAIVTRIGQRREFMACQLAPGQVHTSRRQARYHAESRDATGNRLAGAHDG